MSEGSPSPAPEGGSAGTPPALSPDSSQPVLQASSLESAAGNPPARAIDVFKGPSLVDIAIAANSLSSAERDLLHSSAASNAMASRSYSYGLGELGVEVDKFLQGKEQVSAEHTGWQAAAQSPSRPSEQASRTSPEQRAWLAENPGVVGAGVILGTLYAASADIPLAHTFSHTFNFSDNVSARLEASVSAGSSRHPESMSITASKAIITWSF